MTAKDRDNILKAIQGISIDPERVPFKAVCTYYQENPNQLKGAVALMNKYLKKKNDWIRYEDGDYQLSAEGVVLIVTKIITANSLHAQVQLIEKIFTPDQEDEEEISVQKTVTLGSHSIRILGPSLQEAIENPWFYGQDILKWLGYACAKTGNCNPIPICTLPEGTHKKVLINGVQRHIVNTEGVKLLIKRRISDMKQKLKSEFSLAMKSLTDIQIFEEEIEDNDVNVEDNYEALLKALILLSGTDALKILLDRLAKKGDD